MTKILGHEDIIAVLKKSVDEKRTAHSYLFSGIEGIGKKLIAIEFACMLNCPAFSSIDHRNCKTCERIRKGIHADVRIEKPLKGSIRIDRVRQLQGFLKYSPIEAPYRVIILDDAHTINRPAQNALLKVLEEPPVNSILVLVTSKASALLPTVRSRLRRIKFPPLDRSVVAEELSRIKEIPQEEAMAIAGLSSGSLGHALELLSTNTLKLRNSLTGFLSNAPDYGLAGLLELSAQVSSEAPRLVEAIHFGMTWIRDLLLIRIGTPASFVVNTDLIDILKTSAQHYSVEELLAMHDEMANGLMLVDSDTNINRNLVADVMFLRLREKLSQNAVRSNGPSVGKG